jgi:hypothetical protein
VPSLDTSGAYQPPANVRKQRRNSPQLSSENSCGINDLACGGERWIRTLDIAHLSPGISGTIPGRWYMETGGRLGDTSFRCARQTSTPKSPEWWAPSGIAAIPTPRLIRPTVRRLLRSPRLSGPGPRFDQAGEKPRVMGGRLPTRSASETRSKTPDNADRGTAALSRYPAVSRDIPSRAPDRDGWCRTTARPT